MNYVVTIDQKHEYRIEAETKAMAEAMAVRQFSKEHQAAAARPEFGRVTRTVQE